MDIKFTMINIKQIVNGGIRLGRGFLKRDVLLGNKIYRSATSHQELIDSKALFVISPGRSGTKSLIDYCTRNTNLYCVHAPYPWVATVGYLYHKGEVSADAAWYSFYTAREHYLKNTYKCGLVFFDGDCKNLPLVMEIGRRMPNARFLHVVRNPVSFIKSGLARGYYLDKPSALWGHLEPKDELTRATQLEKIAYLWNEANLIAEKAKVEFTSSRVQTIVSDKMFNNPRVVLQALEKLGLADQIIDKVENKMKILNKQTTGIIKDGSVIDDIDEVVRDKCPTASLYFG